MMQQAKMMGGMGMSGMGLIAILLIVFLITGIIYFVRNSRR